MVIDAGVFYHDLRMVTRVTGRLGETQGTTVHNDDELERRRGDGGDG